MFRPLYGGALARPHDHWPELFSGTFWQNYPYFLPCLASVSFTAIAFLIAALFLKEVGMVFSTAVGADQFANTVITAQVGYGTPVECRRCTRCFRQERFSYPHPYLNEDLLCPGIHCELCCARSC